MASAYFTGSLIDRDFKITRREIIQKQRRDVEGNGEAPVRKAPAGPSIDSPSTSIETGPTQTTQASEAAPQKPKTRWGLGFFRSRPKSAEELQIEEELKRRLGPDELLNFPVERARLRSLPICELKSSSHSAIKRISDVLIESGIDSLVFYGNTLAYGWLVRYHVSLAVPIIVMFIRTFELYPVRRPTLILGNL